jgi:hypothetical protein
MNLHKTTQPLYRNNSKTFSIPIFTKSTMDTLSYRVRKLLTTTAATATTAATTTTTAVSHSNSNNSNFLKAPF